MTDALTLCVACMRFGCATPGKCSALPIQTGDASEALWLSYGAVFEPPPYRPEGASAAPRPAAPDLEKIGAGAGQGARSAPPISRPRDVGGAVQKQPSKRTRKRP